MSAPKSPTATKPPPSKRGPSANGDIATRQRVIDATVACVLELGFYRSSTNEIARRARVTWGVIQHYFGTREKLMVAVLQNGNRHFVELVEGVAIEGDTVRDRMGQLVDLFAVCYARPEYLVDLQVLLSSDRRPPHRNRGSLTRCARWRRNPPPTSGGWSTTRSVPPPPPRISSRRSSSPSVVSGSASSLDHVPRTPRRPNVIGSPGDPPSADLLTPLVDQLGEAASP